MSCDMDTHNMYTPADDLPLNLLPLLECSFEELLGLPPGSLPEWDDVPLTDLFPVAGYGPDDDDDDVPLTILFPAAGVCARRAEPDYDSVEPSDREQVPPTTSAAPLGPDDRQLADGRLPHPLCKQASESSAHKRAVKRARSRAGQPSPKRRR